MNEEDGWPEPELISNDEIYDLLKVEPYNWKKKLV